MTESTAKPAVSIVVPVINAAGYLPDLFKAFEGQTLAPAEIILVDSNSKDRTREIAGSWPKARVIPIPEFSHGKARNMGAREARGEFVVLTTQDALPANPCWLQNLLAPFDDPRVAAAYSRQVPRPNASPMERFFLQTHFPPGDSERRARHPGETLTFARAFFSNVSAAIRRDLLLKYPFDESLIMSEDQQVSRDLMNAGYAVIYAPESIVTHSHNYSLRTCFKRYFDSVYSLTQIFPEHGMGTSASMGLSYLRREAGYVSQNAPLWLPYYALYTAAKTGGTIAGHFADRLPRWLVRRLSLHAYHWRRP